MADSKYGRLFTEDDVRAFARLAFSLGHSGAVTIEPNRDVTDVVMPQLLENILTCFPADEPLFLLRGQDKAAPGAISGDPETAETGNYLDWAYQEGASQEFMAAVNAAAKEMREWQRAHPDRVKVPD